MSLLFKPHHNTLTRNYDINVLITVVEGKGKRVVWHDRRKRASSFELDGSGEESLMGIVLNIPVKRYGRFWKSRHWIAIIKINGIWYYLDSDLVAPKAFEGTEQVRGFLDAMIGIDGQVFLVMNRKL